MEEEEIAKKRDIIDFNRMSGRFPAMVRFSGIPTHTHMTKRLFTFIKMAGNEEALAAAMNFAAGGAGHHLLTFVGEAGRGKTHLALGIGWHWLEVKDELVKYDQVESLLDELRAGFNAETHEQFYNFDQKMERMKTVPLLILDDLGVEQSTPWARAKLDEIVDFRYSRELPMVVTTNMKFNELQDRIASRLSEGICIPLTCDDYRQHIAEMREKGADNGS